MRAVIRVWAAAFLAAHWDGIALGLAAVSIAGGLRPAGELIKHLPVVGSTTNNVVAVRRGWQRKARPLVVVAHLDSHSVGRSPPSRAQSLAAALSAGVVVATALAGRTALGSAWRVMVALAAIEGAIQIVWFARRELETAEGPPDDNDSGLHALARLSELLSGARPARDTWLVATSAATTGGQGMTAFLRRHPDLRGKAWVVEVDALGAGEVLASPFSARFPRPGTPPSLVRAVEAAAQRSGDPLRVRKVRRWHSDARSALRARTPGICITGGLHPTAGQPGGPDPANAARAALLAATLARTED